MKAEDHILKIVSDHLNIPIIEIKGNDRQGKIIEARHIFCYLCRSLLPLSLQQVGNVINKDHATVYYAVKAIEDKISIYPVQKIAIENLMETVRERIECLASDLIIVNDDIYMENDCYK